MYRLPKQQFPIETFPPFDDGADVRENYAYSAWSNREGFYLQPSARYPGFWWFYKVSAAGWEGFLRPMRGNAFALFADKLIPSGLTWKSEAWDGTEYEPPQERASTQHSDTIYFIEAEGLDRVKIGLCTGDPSFRVSNLQTGSPVRLRLLAQSKGDSRAERALHKQFESLRIHGEWFHLEGALLAHIQSLKGNS